MELLAVLIQQKSLTELTGETDSAEFRLVRAVLLVCLAGGGGRTDSSAILCS